VTRQDEFAPKSDPDNEEAFITCWVKSKILMMRRRNWLIYRLMLAISIEFAKADATGRGSNAEEFVFSLRLD
jgi:hypothetical protein